MRILHVITNLKPGGAERLMVDLLPRIKESGEEINLLLFDGLETPFKKELEREGVRLLELSRSHDINGKDHVYNPMNLLKLLKYIGKYDIIHTHNTVCQLYVPIAKALKHSRARLVTTEHNTTNRRRTIRWFKPIDRWMYNHYEAIICISDQAHDSLVEYIGEKSSITTIYNGVKVKKFCNPIRDINSHDKYVITMIAAFRPQKDHETLLKSMLLLPDNYSLQLVGRGPNESHVKAICASLRLENRVSFLGMRSDVSAILEKSDVVVLSSHWEGLSLSSIEGMASGRPFIASDVDGLREMVDGAGILFPRGDDKELARKIRCLCENPNEYREVASRCQAKAKQYDISIMAQKYMDLYKEILSKNQ